KLTDKGLKSEIKEVELCYCFIDPILSALFDDPENGILFRCTTNQEYKESSAKRSISSQRPDSCVSELDGLYFGSSLGYVEVKPASEANNNGTFKLCGGKVAWTPLRQGPKPLQITNHKFTFFMNKLQADGLYIFTEIASIKSPTCIEDLGTYLNYFDGLTAVLNCYENNCIPLRRGEISTIYVKRRPTLRDKQFDSLYNNKIK
ncbi:hypothetical protein BDA99DRAFT_582763, partial [Phascolomyces articulosus]